MKISEFLEKVKLGATSIEEHTHKVLEEARKVNERYHYFNTISEELALRQAKEIDKRIKKQDTRGSLLGVPISVKDNICVQCVESTAGSAILRGYKPTFNATAVRKAIQEGAVIIGKTAQDEFGFGSFCTNVGKGYEVPKNPVDTERVCGGSSGGAAGWTRKTSNPHIALAESTGGSIVNPASFCGVVGVCPTYGRVSRYGLIDYASSLDKIGVMGKTVEEAAILLKAVSGHDGKDATCTGVPVPDYVQTTKDGVEKMKIGIVQEFLENVDEEILRQMKEQIKKLEQQGAEVQEVSLPLAAKYGLSSYYILAMAEASTNLAKYCGMRYGKHEDLEGGYDQYFTKVRTQNIGFEAKRRMLLGTFARMAGYRDAFYMKALQLRTLIINEYKKAFEQVNVLAFPTMPCSAPTFEEVDKMSALQAYTMDVLTVSQNLAGLPHMTIPLESRGLPTGMQMVAPHFKEEWLFRAGGTWQ